MGNPPSCVVVVDGHPVVRYGLIAMLQSQPDIVVVGAVVNGVEALALILTAQPDVAILDQFLSQFSGNCAPPWPDCARAASTASGAQPVVPICVQV